LKTVLVTGAAGFLGGYVARHFAGRGLRVIGIDIVPDAGNAASALAAYHQIDLPSPALREVLRREQPQVLIHCAGRASVPWSMTDPAGDFQSSVVLTFALLDNLRLELPSCRFLLLSSAAIYGNPHSLPVREEHAVEPLSPYGFHKRQCEQLCSEFSAIYGIPTASARVFSAYGPGLRRQVIWDICEKVQLTGKLALHGTGNESRDFIHAVDIAQGLWLLAEKAPCRGEVYNLASGREVTIAELAETVLSALGSTVQPVFDGAATPGNPLHWRADIAKISALGFAPQISFENGMTEMARWSRAELAGR
jgi:UDP-glucose 4-epimerase